jgi:hypothetical protein
MRLDDIDRDGQMEIVASQGGYQGKGDFTSGYSEPHVYIIDGKTREFEHVLGERDLLGTVLTAILLLLVVVALIEISILTKDRMAARTAKAAAEEAARAKEGRTTKSSSDLGGVPGWNVDLGDEEDGTDGTDDAGEGGRA